jgi:hypothetical protein
MVRFTAVVLLPTPPLPLITRMTERTPGIGSSGPMGLVLLVVSDMLRGK